MKEAHNWCLFQKALKVLLEPKNIFTKNVSNYFKSTYKQVLRLRYKFEIL